METYVLFKDFPKITHPYGVFLNNNHIVVQLDRTLISEDYYRRLAYLDIITVALRYGKGVPYLLNALFFSIDDALDTQNAFNRVFSQKKGSLYVCFCDEIVKQGTRMLYNGTYYTYMVNDNQIIKRPY